MRGWFWLRHGPYVGGVLKLPLGVREEGHARVAPHALEPPNHVEHDVGVFVGQPCYILERNSIGPGPLDVGANVVDDCASGVGDPLACPLQVEGLAWKASRQHIDRGRVLVESGLFEAFERDPNLH